MSDRLIKKILKKRAKAQRKKIIEPIVGGTQERPGRSNPKIIPGKRIEPLPYAYGDFIKPIMAIDPAGPVKAKKVVDVVIEGDLFPLAIYECKCGYSFEFALGAYGCPNCMGDNGAAEQKVTPESWPHIEPFPAFTFIKTAHLRPPKPPTIDKITFKKLFPELFPEPATNLDARERLERQISDLMTEVNRGVRVYNNATKDALDLLEIARTTAYTEPLGEVSAALSEAKMKLSKYFPLESQRAYRLANLAVEIEKSEEPKKEK
jgi:hypothetical protein